MAAPQRITSSSNPLIKMLKRAVSRGELTTSGCMIAESLHLLEEALRSPVEIEHVVVSASAARLLPTGVEAIEVEDRLFDEVASTEASQGVITLVRPRVWQVDDLLQGVPLVVVLDGLQDPGNAGAVLRAAEAFGATGAVFLKGTVSPFNPKAVRASAGSIFRVPHLVAMEAREVVHLKLPFYAAMPRASLMAAQANLGAACVIAIGNEGRGVSAAIQAAAQPIAIPTLGVESLNAAVAAGILLYEARRQRM